MQETAQCDEPDAGPFKEFVQAQMNLVAVLSEQLNRLTAESMVTRAALSALAATSPDGLHKMLDVLAAPIEESFEPHASGLERPLRVAVAEVLASLRRIAPPS